MTLLYGRGVRGRKSRQPPQKQPYWYAQAELGQREYKLKWVGYSLAESTWEPVENLGTIEELIDDYHKQTRTKRDSPMSKQRKQGEAPYRPPSRSSSKEELPKKKRGRPRKVKDPLQPI